MGKVIGIALIDRKGGPVVVHSSAKVTIDKGVGDDHRGRDHAAQPHCTAGQQHRRAARGRCRPGRRRAGHEGQADHAAPECRHD